MNSALGSHAQKVQFKGPINPQEKKEARTIARDGTNRGGRRAKAGSKPTPLADKLAAGKSGKRIEIHEFEPETLLVGGDIGEGAELEGADMPDPSEYLSAKQKDGTTLGADELFRETWLWLKERGCEKLVSPRVLEGYAQAFARYIQCEQAVSQYGLLGKHPTTGGVVTSPFVTMSQSFQNKTARQILKAVQMMMQWSDCSVQGKEIKPMIEKVNPSHPDKIADRIAGAIVDLAYQEDKNPKIAVEILIGHGICHVIIETSTALSFEEVRKAIKRIAGDVKQDIVVVPQDEELAENQVDAIRCGDNGIFKGVPLTDEQLKISKIVRELYEKYPTDGKFILDGERLIICQSHAKTAELKDLYPFAQINPLGDWTGGTDVDTGATNRKLGSDMADSVTGGGLHGKDLSKADVSINIHAFLKAQQTGKPVELICAIGDEEVDGLPYSVIVEEARDFVNQLGGFEKLAEWGLF